MSSLYGWTVRQVEQTKQGVCSPLPPPHQKRSCIYGTLLRLPLGNAAIFKEARSPGALIHRQTPVWHALAHLHVHTRFQLLLGSASLTHRQDERERHKMALLISATSAPPSHWLKCKGLFVMIDSSGKALSGPAATGTIQRWRVQCCWQQPRSLVCGPERLF